MPVTNCLLVSHCGLHCYRGQVTGLYREAYGLALSSEQELKLNGLLENFAPLLVEECGSF